MTGETMTSRAFIALLQDLFDSPTHTLPGASTYLWPRAVYLARSAARQFDVNQLLNVGVILRGRIAS